MLDSDYFNRTHRPQVEAQLREEREEARDAKRVHHWPEEIAQQSSNRGLAVSKHRYSMDFFGVAIDQRKSDLQKAVRRGLTEQALVSFFAVYNMTTLFPELQKREAKVEKSPRTPAELEASAAKGNQTNVVNRLLVIAMEDVGLANPHLVRSIVPVLHDMSKTPAKRDPYKLAWIVTQLCESKKSRLCSHAARAYLLVNRERALQMGLKLGDGEVTLASLNCFEWLDEKSPIAKSPDEIFGIIRAKFEGPFRHPPLLPMFETLIKVYKGLSSDFAKPAAIRYILALAHFLVADDARAKFVQEQIAMPTEPVRDHPDRALVDRLQSHDKALYDAHPVMTDSVDYHTSAGRRSGASKELFRLVGAHVENESELMVDPVLKSIYEDVQHIV